MGSFPIRGTMGAASRLNLAVKTVLACMFVCKLLIPSPRSIVCPDNVGG
jgi:hypothetical protein